MPNYVLGMNVGDGNPRDEGLISQRWESHDLIIDVARSITTDTSTS